MFWWGRHHSLSNDQSIRNFVNAYFFAVLLLENKEGFNSSKFLPLVPNNLSARCSKVPPHFKFKAIKADFRRSSPRDASSLKNKTVLLREGVVRGVTMGGSKEGTIPRAPNDCGGRRKAPTMSLLSSINICFRQTSGSNMGPPYCFLVVCHTMVETKPIKILSTMQRREFSKEKLQTSHNSVSSSYSYGHHEQFTFSSIKQYKNLTLWIWVNAVTDDDFCITEHSQRCE